MIEQMCFMRRKLQFEIPGEKRNVDFRKRDPGGYRREEADGNAISLQLLQDSVGAGGGTGVYE